MYKVAEASKRVWTSGCIEVIRIWAERNLYTIAGVALGVALSQVQIKYFSNFVIIYTSVFFLFYCKYVVLASYYQLGKNTGRTN